MIVPAITWGLVALSELGTSPMLGPIALTASILASLSTIGAWMMKRWTAYAFAGWSLIAVAWEPGLQAAFGSLSTVRAITSVVVLGLSGALASVLHRKIARHEREHPRSQGDSSVVW